MTMHSALSAPLPFRSPEGVLGALGPAQAADVVALASDIAMVLDRQGVIRDISIGSTDLAKKGLAEWLDQSWIETVTVESRHKVSEILRDASLGLASRWREINHPSGTGDNLPIRYFAVDTGQDGRVIILGRDLQSNAALQQRLLQVQQAVERDYLKLRQAEARYRLLFESASEAVLVLDAGTRKVREANSAAARLTGLPHATINGQAFQALLDRGSVEAALEFLNTKPTVVSSASGTVRLVSGLDCTLAASLFRQEKASCLLVRLTPLNTIAHAGDPVTRLASVLDRIPDGFVVTNADMAILAVNPAFLDLTHLSSQQEAISSSLERFLGRPQIDIKVMVSQLREHGSLRNFSTIIRGVYGESEEVEVSAVCVPDGDQTCYGFSIRGVARRFAAPVPSLSGAAMPEPRTVEQLTQLIGRVPMKDIVRESSDLIERLCIEAALTLTSDNRASAADVLGLSRQSLYSKLRRYRLGNLDDLEE
jgi:transcriptional regulator PpsR